MKYSDVIRYLVLLVFGLLLLASFLTKTTIDQGGIRWIGFIASGIGLCSVLFEKWAWRWPGVRWVSKLLGVPDLKGTWVGDWKYDVDSDGQPGSTSAYMIIRQTFLTIQVSAYFGEKTNSKSHTLIAAIDEYVKGEKQLIYTYRNIALHTQRDTNPTHEGTGVLDLVGGRIDRMEGSYFTSRPGGRGSIIVSKISSTTSNSYTDALQLHGRIRRK